MKRAFTLVELLVVLALLALLMTWAVPSPALFRHELSRREYQALKSDLKELRNYAILSGRTTTFSVAGGGKSYELCLGEDSRKVELQASTLVLSGFRNYDIHFYPRGISDQAGTIVFRGAHGRRVLTLRPVTGVIGEVRE